MIKKNFGNKLQEIRKSRFLSQDDLAKKLSIDRAQISKIEKGKINVTLETVERLANALEVSVLDFFSLEKKPHPFVKWAGGKTQILPKLKELMPAEYNKYFEPFVGGGALFFSISPKYAHINDLNSELFCAYQCFEDDEHFELLKSELIKHEENNSEEYYYQIRKLDQEDGFSKTPIHIRAARMIYLNKACFNGLYRVNSKGFFNVPFGKKDKVNAFDDSNFDNLRKLLSNKKIKITNNDFEIVVAEAKKGDFVYFDPPYDIYPDKNGFVNYSKEGFGREEQLRLRNCFCELTKRGVKVMLSNHNTPFIKDIYSDFKIHVIKTKRMINSKAQDRDNGEEVIITNY